MAGATPKEDLLNRIEKAAHDYEMDFHGCSRCVVKALQDHLQIGDASILKASTPLAAGVAFRGETCGALLGGMLVVGAFTATDDLKDAQALANAMGSGFRLARKVEKEFGTTTCARIQEARLGRFFNLADPDQYKAFREADGYSHCSKVVGRIARISAEFILDLIERNEKKQHS